MTDKPNQTPESNQPSGRPSGSGPTAGSPYDNPTGEFPSVKPAVGKDVPRTEDDLGLDPDVPAAGAEHTGATKTGKGPTATAAAGATAASAAHPGAASGTEHPGTEHPGTEPSGTDHPGSEHIDAEHPGSVPSGAEPAGAEAPTYAFATIPPARANGDTERLRRPREYRRGTLDLGLLGLRLTVGLTFLYHGLQKLAGWFHGPGLDGTRHMLEQGGWKHIELSTAMLTVSEVGGGALIILGLATPLAAGAVLASISTAWLWKQGMAPDFQYRPVELESILAGAAASLILTGPGRLSFDRNRGWAVRPSWGSFVCLVLAFAAAAGGWIFLHGGNPFVGIF
ncbi:DoxX family protein [Nocardia africana]|uniref:DoxX family protein n=1 Tax=Nocardia africana TaxID=134964 RepID=A0ABW6NJU5_9NOCA